MNTFRKITSTVDGIIGAVMGSGFNIPENDTVKKHPYLLTYR